MTNHIQDFRAEMMAAGLQPPAIIERGKFHKFAGDGKGTHNKAGWCKLFDDGLGGIYGDYSTDLSTNWQAKREKPFTDIERAEHKRQIAEAKKQFEAEEVMRKTEARELAMLTLAEAFSCTEHAYLTRKGIESNGAKRHGDRLVLPMRDTTGTLHSLQFISEDGAKKFLTGGRVTGCYFGIGKPDGVLCIAEGFATGASIHQATGYAVAVAFNAGNLLPVAKALREKFPDLKLVVCADDDHRTDGNTGLSKAKEAAQVVGGVLAIPNFSDARPENATDFNDLHKIKGIQEVRNCIEAVIRAPVAGLIVVSDTEALPAIIGMPPIAITSVESDDEVIARLAELSPLEYDRARKNEAKALNCSTAVLDGMVKTARNKVKEVDTLPFPNVEPHDEPIEPALLLNEISDTIRQFIILDKEQADAAALWIAFTWFIDDVEVAPLAIINAPEKACGKSQLLSLIGRLVARPLPASNSSAAGLFRAVELWRPTVLIDEADTFIRENEELKGMVNAGHTRANAFVLRVVGDNHEPKLFKVWGAKAFAGIALEKHLPDATMSRAIVFELRRKLSHENVTRLRYAPAGLFDVISSKLARFADDYSQQVKQARPQLPEALSDRAQDNWEPLYAIASCAGADWLNRVNKAALKLSGAGEKSVSTGNELLADIYNLFEKKQTSKIKVGDLITGLCEDEECAWAGYNRGKPISPKQVARLLSAYEIKSKPLRDCYDVYRGFEKEQFTDAFARYLTPLDLPLQSYKPLEANNGVVSRVTSVTSRNSNESQQVTLETAPVLDCNDVTAKTAIFEGATNTPSEQLHVRI